LFAPYNAFLTFFGQNLTKKQVLSPVVGSSYKQDLQRFTLDECCNFLTLLGLQHLKDIFQENNMDGPLLLVLAHPQLGAVMLSSMDITESDQQILVQGIKDHQM
jgi:hypothetical protein